VDPSLSTLAQAVLAGSRESLISHEAVVLATGDIEAVHQARVATRRLRSDLRTFRPVIQGDPLDGLRSELRWLGGELGRVRDADVLVDGIAAHACTLPHDERPAVDALLARGRAERASELDRARVALRSPRYAALLDRLAAVIDERDHDDAEWHPKRRAHQLVRRPWRRLRRTVRALPDDPTDEQLHEVRKRAKQARYALEAMEPVASKRAARLARRLATLQDRLGAQHDAIVATAWLRAAATDEPATAFAAGMVADEFLRAAADVRARWPAAWRRVRRAGRDVF
jgi:CHAD domain-containing protein